MAVLATITYNAASGSDTAASGGTLPATAITHTGRSTLDGDDSNTFTFNDAGTHDCSGGADDGSDVLWVAASSADRHLHRITSYTGGIATCTAIVVAETMSASISASNWAIGGKRATFENDTGRYDWEDWNTGWTVELDDDQTINAALTLPNVGSIADSPLHIKPSAATGIIGISQAADADIITCIANTPVFILERLKTSWTSSRAQNALVIPTSNGTQIIKGCVFDGTNGSTAGISIANGTGGFPTTFIDCEIHDFGGDGVSLNGRLDIQFQNTSIHDNGGNGINVLNSTTGLLVCMNCLVYGNTTHGIDLSAVIDVDPWPVILVGNIFYLNGSSGIDANATVDYGIRTFYNNVFLSNGAFGIDDSATGAIAIEADYNHYYNNTTAPRNAGTLNTNDTTGDPEFVSTVSGSEDFSPRSTSPLRNRGIPIRRA